MPSDKNVNSLRYGSPHSLSAPPRLLTGCCCLLNGQQFIYCPFLLLFAINKSLIVFGRRRGQGWQLGEHTFRRWQCPTKGNCVCWATGRGNGRTYWTPDSQWPKDKQSCRQLFNAFLYGHPCPPPAPSPPSQAVLNEAPVYSIVSLLSRTLCVWVCVCLAMNAPFFALLLLFLALYILHFFFGCSLSIDTKQKANWKVSRSHIFIAYFEASLP